MKKELRIRKGEKLYEWIKRIAPLCTSMTADQMEELLTVVSKESYFDGVRLFKNMTAN